MVEQQIRTHRKKITEINAQIQRVQEQIENMQRAKDNKANELRYLQNSLSQLESSKNARLNLLARIDKSAHAGVQWLYRNQNLFKSDIYGPMLLEVCCFYFVIDFYIFSFYNIKLLPVIFLFKHLIKKIIKFYLQSNFIYI